MTKKDFFILLIKLFGLHSLIITLFTFLPSTINYIGNPNYILILLSSIIGIILIVALYWLIINKANFIVEKLNLSKGFEDNRIEFSNIDSSAIIKISIILIGGWLFIENLPKFLNYCYIAFLEIGSNKGLVTNVKQIQFNRKLDYFQLTISIINLIIGYLLVSNYKWFSEKLTRSEEKQ